MSGGLYERLRELHEQAIPPPWLAIGDEVSRPEVDIVRWSYSDLPPSEWPDAEQQYAPVISLIAEMRNALPAILSLIEAARQAATVVQAIAAYGEDVNMDHLVSRAVDVEPLLTSALDELEAPLYMKGRHD